jgi:hypothetical protein
MTKKPKTTVAQYLEQQIALSEKSQREIAAECGYERPNILTMIKQGDTKLPLNKVGLMAKALGVDPIHLLRLTMSEYMPETWGVLEELIGEQLVSEKEMTLIHLARDVTDGVDLDYLEDGELRKAVASAIKPFSDKERKGLAGVARASRTKRIT